MMMIINEMLLLRHYLQLITMLISLNALYRRHHAMLIVVK